jgi:hypothetical protein
MYDDVYRLNDKVPDGCMDGLLLGCIDGCEVGCIDGCPVGAVGRLDGCVDG